MTDNKWDDRKIEKLLKNIPDIKDHRSKSEIISRLKEDDRLQVRTRNKKKNWMPAIAAVAALLVLSLLIPSMLRDSEKSQSDISSGKQTNEAAMDTANRSSKMQTDSASDSNSSEESEAAIAYSVQDSSVINYAVYPDEVMDGTVLHLGFAGDAAESVPVTFIIPAGQIIEDFDNTAPDSFDLYMKYADRIDEEALGFSQYHPYKGSLKKDGQRIIHTLPNDHGYDTASAAFENYMHTLQDTFYGFKEVSFTNEDGTSVEFDQVGEVSKPLQLGSGKNSQNYYLFTQNNGTEFLSSNFGKSYATLEKALYDMKEKPNDIYSSVIPTDVDFKVSEKQDLTIIEFKNVLDLEALEPKIARQLVDGLLLTGASFGKQMQFENVRQAEWNGFDFTKQLPIPIGANPQPFLLR